MAETKKQKQKREEVKKHNQKTAQLQQYTAKLNRERRTLLLKMEQLDENTTN